MTNETLHTLETRRSCRAYKPEQITKEELEAVLRAGTFAPSAMNRQSAKIVVVQDAETRAQLTRMNAAVMGNTGDPMYGASANHSGGAGGCQCPLWRAGRRPCDGQPDECCCRHQGWAAAGSTAQRKSSRPKRARPCSKKWGIEGDYIGVGHCILGYPAEEPRPAAPRKPDYIVYA